MHENFFIGEDSLSGKKCHEIAFYYLMKSRGTRELDSNSYNPQGIKENMYWIPINNLSDYSEYPTFLKRN